MQQVLPPSDSYDYVAGVVAGGVPLAVMLSQVTGKPMLMVTRKTLISTFKTHLASRSDQNVKLMELEI
jgi:adenine/guanine phosphoribosyltransferase-like PRPP-binding protein